MGPAEPTSLALAAAAEKLFGMSDDEYSRASRNKRNDTINEIMLLSDHGGGAGQVPAHQYRGDDLMTSIVNAEVDGQRLTDEEIGAFLILLASAGSDTTRQATSHAMMALVEQPGPAGLADGGLREPNRTGRSRSSSGGPRR